MRRPRCVALAGTLILGFAATPAANGIPLMEGYTHRHVAGLDRSAIQISSDHKRIEGCRESLACDFRRDDKSSGKGWGAYTRIGGSTVASGREYNEGVRVPYQHGSGLRNTEYPFVCDMSEPTCRSQAHFRWNGDKLYVTDTKRDGLSALVLWNMNQSGRYGICRNTYRRGITVMCDKNFTESDTNYITLCAGIYNPDTDIVRWDLGITTSVTDGFLLDSSAHCNWD
jgi:hypothetical protein